MYLRTATLREGESRSLQILVEPAVEVLDASGLPEAGVELAEVHPQGHYRVHLLQVLHLRHHSNYYFIKIKLPAHFYPRLFSREAPCPKQPSPLKVGPFSFSFFIMIFQLYSSQG